MGMVVTKIDREKKIVTIGWTDNPPPTTPELKPGDVLGCYGGLRVGAVIYGPLEAFMQPED